MNLIDRIRASENIIIKLLLNFYRFLLKFYFYITLSTLISFKELKFYNNDDKKKNIDNWNHTYVFKNWLKILTRNNTSDHSEMWIILTNSEYKYLLHKYKYLLENKALTVIDAWWNIWLFTIFMNLYFDIKKSFIIEPDEENLKILKYNLSINNIINYTLFEKALYINESEIGFDTNQDHDWKRIDLKILNKKVKTISIWTIFKQNNLDTIDLLKMDIEWWEWYLIKNINDKKFYNRINLIVIEYHLDSENKRKEDIIDYFDWFNHYIAFSHSAWWLIYFTKK